MDKILGNDATEPTKTNLVHLPRFSATIRLIDSEMFWQQKTYPPFKIYIWPNLGSML
jgi:hypothetical protein